MSLCMCVYLQSSLCVCFHAPLVQVCFHKLLRCFNLRFLFVLLGGVFAALPLCAPTSMLTPTRGHAADDAPGGHGRGDEWCGSSCMVASNEWRGRRRLAAVRSCSSSSSSSSSSSNSTSISSSSSTASGGVGGSGGRTTHLPRPRLAPGGALWVVTSLFMQESFWRVHSSMRGSDHSSL